MQPLQLAQINLHHCRAATAALIQLIKREKIDAVLIQEPWLSQGKVRGLEAAGKIWSVAVTENLRACILTRRGLNITFLPQLSDDRTCAINVGIKDRKGTTRNYTIVSLYSQWNDDGYPFGEKGEEILEWCREKNSEILIGMDANAQHELWGCSENNARGNKLMDEITIQGLACANKGSEPTFVTAARSTILDVTICSESLQRDILGWRVLNNVASMSDHRYIRYNLRTNERKLATKIRNPRKTNWDQYRKTVEKNASTLPRRYGNQEEIDEANNQLTKLLRDAWEMATTEKRLAHGTGKHWWTEALSTQQKEVTRLQEKARRSGKKRDWSLANSARKCFRKQAKEVEIKAWRTYCDQISEVSQASKMNKALTAAGGANEVGAVIGVNGRYTAKDDEILLVLLKEHFPGFTVRTDDGETSGGTSTVIVTTVEPEGSNSSNNSNANRVEKNEKEGTNLNKQAENERRSGSNWPLGNAVVNLEKVGWAIGSFNPFKTPGPDKIFPKMLQEAFPTIGRFLTNLLKACVALGTLPTEWGHTKVVFIPKPGKPNYATAKAFRPISLTSYLLKTAEKLIDRHLKEGVLRRKPLHKRQHAFRTGHSTEVALHEIIRETEEALAADAT